VLRRFLVASEILEHPAHAAAWRLFDEALSVADQWWQARECRPVTIGSDAAAIFFDWMTLHALVRTRLLDTMLAASYRAAGVTRIATTDWRDFTVFEGFDIVRMEPSDRR
jgi:hypothetical protein